jgi:NADH dehydrogenase FAD-containing subunit
VLSSCSRLARRENLDDAADVVLVEPKDSFVHNVASLRALVNPSWLPRIYLPYGRLLGNGRVVRDRAAKVDAGRVTLALGEQIRADYIVLATGSGYPFPAKSDVDLTAAAHDKVRAAHAALSRAQRVLLLGAGPVGIELAGEIKAVWPGKHVTLLDVADDVLGERFRPDLKAELRRQLGDIGVELLLSSPLREEPPAHPGELGAFTVVTQAGAAVAADIWFRCYGVVPASEYLVGELAAARRPDGFVEVTASLQVIGHERVFAVGDVSAADHKMAGVASRQAQVVADNIRALISGDGELRRHEPTGPGIMVPIGPRGGAGQRAGVDELPDVRISVACGDGGPDLARARRPAPGRAARPASGRPPRRPAPVPRARRAASRRPWPASPRPP